MIQRYLTPEEQKLMREALRLSSEPIHPAVRNAIIEECARVAEFKSYQFFDHTKDMALAIAAAIRALKDKP